MLLTLEINTRKEKKERKGLTKATKETIKGQKDRQKEIKLCYCLFKM